MELIKRIVLKLFGKKVDEELQKFGISKTKVAMIVSILLPAVEQLSATLGHPIVIPQSYKDMLVAFGLWAMKDGLDGPKLTA